MTKWVRRSAAEIEVVSALLEGRDDTARRVLGTLMYAELTELSLFLADALKLVAAEMRASYEKGWEQAAAVARRRPKKKG